MKNKADKISPDLIIIDRTTTTGRKTKITSDILKRNNDNIPVLIINQKLSDLTASFEPAEDVNERLKGENC